MMRIAIIVGARPNFMKAAPLVRALRQYSSAEPMLVHTGQHYDDRMSRVFFEELQLPQPDFWLGSGGRTHAEQTARIMVEFEQALPSLQPDVIVVCGDVNSTLACSLVAAKAGIPIAHVEAGLRSYDRSMPEEINRVVTDALASVLYTTSRQAGKNLQNEGIAADRIVFVGNVMIDTLLAFVDRSAQTEVLERMQLLPAGYALVTLHRPSNVDEPQALAEVVDLLTGLQEILPVVFPLHPRTEQRLAEAGADHRLAALPRLTTTPPLGYLEFIQLLRNATIVLTDSGGIQEETTVLGVPCLTMRENTERPETVNEGTNRLVGRDRERILTAVRVTLSGQRRRGRIPELWDGRAAARIGEDLLARFHTGALETQE